MKILMFAHGGSENRGCEAIVRSTSTMLKEKMEDVTVFLSSYHPETDQQIQELDGIFDGSETVIRKYSTDWWKSAIRNKLFQDETYAWQKTQQKTIAQIDVADICLSIGGDNYCYGEQPGWYEVNKMVKKKGKKLVLWGCSIGEEDMSARKLADLNTFDLILARETYTYQMLKKKGIKQVALCGDPAFTLEKEEVSLPLGWKDDDTIGLNISPLLVGKNQGSKQAVSDLIDYILANTESVIALTPHVIQKGNNDYDLLQEYDQKYKSSGRVILLPPHLNALQYKGYIAKMRFFIGARTHATIAAYSSFVPTIVLGYSVKSKGIAYDLFNSEKFVVSIEEVSNSSKLIQTFVEMVDQEAQLKEQLQKVIPIVQKRSYEAVHSLKELLI
ncbi:polysaccharide pyruvyl transferase family protein [Cytobacillus sp. FSL K6-0265]|uniref:polysaccharide pyruvyl transferase family protein n=1 Tax=Cytobacillus sp. FSL K6-0265 TaxID=2921448 RepID=UPI0030F82614